MSDRARGLHYQPHLDGLRAVAILLVVAAHARLSGFQGGFVGVDVFFVLSGYLITGLLANELAIRGRVDFTAFYARRFRRLLPALLCMILATAVAGLFLTPASQQGQQSAGAISAALSVSNIYFAFGNQDYFSASTETNLFLHTWSLGVEEQFYLVWPALLLLVARLGKQGGTHHRLKAAMAVVFVLGLSACLLLARTTPSLAFYLMPTRAWQFALGALVFLWLGQGPASDRPLPPQALWRTSMGWGGLAAIIVAALVLDPATPYPSAWALLPSLGTAAVLAGCLQRQRAGLDKVLSIKPLRTLGRLSYSWYLWHWPVLLLGGVLVNAFNPWSRTGLVGLSLAAAVVSYVAVERPLRTSPRLMARPGACVAGGLAAMALVGAIGLAWLAGAQRLLSGPSTSAMYLRFRFDSPELYAMGCDSHFYATRLDVCRFPEERREHVAVLLGDSVAAQWFPAIRRIYERKGWQVVVLTKSACPMVDADFFYDRIGRVYRECSIWRRQALQWIARARPDVVITSSTDTYGFTQVQWTAGMARVLAPLEQSAGQTYLIRSTPQLGFDGPSCLAAHAGKDDGRPEACSAPSANRRREEVFRWEQEAARQFPRVHVIDMDDAACPGAICRAKLGAFVVFRDDHHMTASFARSIAPSLASRLVADGAEGGQSSGAGMSPGHP